LAEEWGGGDRDRDDGVVYVLGIKDHKMRLEVGYGLEDKIPDNAARALIDETRPLLRSKHYADAILAVVDGVVRRTATITPTISLPKREPASIGLLLLFMCAFAWFVSGVVRIGLLMVVLVVRALSGLQVRGYGSQAWSGPGPDPYRHSSRFASSFFSSSSSFSSFSSSSSSSFGGGGASFGGGGASSSW
jgi:uncharacterized protein